MNNSAPELLVDLAGHVAKRVATLPGMTQELADLVGNEVAQEIATAWGGVPLYIPKGFVLQASKKHAEIWKHFTGRNHIDLSRRFNLSLVWIYAVVKRMRGIDQADRQGCLFPPPEA